jgi:hypothetical protein
MPGVSLLLAVLVMLGASSEWSAFERTKAEEAQLSRQRAQLAAKLEQQAHQVDQLKAHANGPVATAQLEAAMSLGQDLAKRLSQIDAEVGRKRREVMAAADQVIANEHNDNLRTQAIAVRADMASALAGGEKRALSSALGVQESASDGPADLTEKADLLKDTEDKIHRELAVLDKRYQAAERRGELMRTMRSLESNPFLEDTRRQHTVAGQTAPTTQRSQGSPPSGTGPQAGGSFTGQGAASPPPPTGGDSNPVATPGPLGAGPGPGAGTGPTTVVGTPGGTGARGPTTPVGALPNAPLGTATAQSSTIDVIALKDLLDPATVVDLNQPKDSVTYLRALDRARQRLRQIAADLDQRSRTLRKRADELRKAH